MDLVVPNDSNDEALLARLFDDELTASATQKPCWCTSCKKQRLCANFDPDRKTCRECLRRQRRRKQRQSRERLKEKVARETTAALTMTMISDKDNLFRRVETTMISS